MLISTDDYVRLGDDALRQILCVDTVQKVVGTTMREDIEYNPESTADVEMSW
jgi:hypothetical protein